MPPDLAVIADPRRVSAPSVVATPLTDAERYGFLVHELRNLANSALVAFEVLHVTDASGRGDVGAVLKRSLSAMRDLISGSVADVRRRQDEHRSVRIAVAELTAEVGAAAALEATGRGLSFRRVGAGAGLAVYADRQMLSAVLVNLLQNAFKFTRPATTVVLGVSATATRVRIEVADECGGLAGGGHPSFHGVDHAGHDGSALGARGGLGLGLAFSRRVVEAAGGRLSARSLPGHGCVFTIDLPRLADRAGPDVAERAAAITMRGIR